MKIGRREVGLGHPVFIIAECGSNHGGSLDRALALIDAAADAGADAAKFQRFRVDHFLVPRENPEALRRYELPDDWLPVLKSKCQSRDLEFLCTAFDYESVKVIAPFVDAFKIGSYEAANRPFRAFVVGFARSAEKVTIASLGRSVEWHDIDMPDIQLVCRSEYPAPIARYLWARPIERWGVSDHTLQPAIVPAAATALGACVVEKHMRAEINWEGPGIDSPDRVVSISPGAFKSMVEAIRLTEKAVRG